MSGSLSAFVPSLGRKGIFNAASLLGLRLPLSNSLAAPTNVAVPEPRDADIPRVQAESPPSYPRQEQGRELNQAERNVRRTFTGLLEKLLPVVQKKNLNIEPRYRFAGGPSIDTDDAYEESGYRSAQFGSPATYSSFGALASSGFVSNFDIQ